MTEECASHGLVTTLLPIVTDDARRDCFHQLLGPYCHHSRNHLNSLKLSLYLARRCEPPAGVDSWHELEERYRVVERFFDSLQMIYRPLKLNPVRLALALLIEDAREGWSDRLAREGRELVFSPPSNDASGDFDPVHLRHALNEFVGWRALIGASEDAAILQWRTDAGDFTLDWIEPGAHQGEHDDVYPECLALPLLARVIAAHGGTLHLSRCEGFRVSLRWPTVIPRRAVEH